MGLERLPQQAPVCCGDEVHEASSPGGAPASCERLRGFLYATYFRAYFGDTLYGKRLRNFIYGLGGSGASSTPPASASGSGASSTATGSGTSSTATGSGTSTPSSGPSSTSTPGSAEPSTEPGAGRPAAGGSKRPRKDEPSSAEPPRDKILVEPINGQYIRQFMNLRGTRALHTSCGRSMFEVLSFILEQSDEDLIKVKVRERRDSGVAAFLAEARRLLTSPRRSPRYRPLPSSA